MAACVSSNSSALLDPAGEGEKRAVMNTKRRELKLDCLLSDCCARLALNGADADALMTRGSLHMRKGQSQLA